jgi:hypothetical protein
MNKMSKIPLHQSHFLTGLCTRNCTATSGYCNHNSQSRYSRYDIGLSEFLEESTYIVRYVDSKGSTFLDYNQDGAIKITISELLTVKPLIEILNTEREHRIPSQENPIEIMTLRCTACNSIVVIDGVHRIIAAANSSPTSYVLEVLEHENSCWPKDIPDMNLICTCDRQENAT